MRTPFRLNKTIGEAYDMDLTDALTAKQALASLGHLEAPDDGFDEYPDRPLIEAVKSFQRAEGLAEDGVMKPDGPTLARLNDSLASRSGLPGPKGSFMPDSRKNPDLRFIPITLKRPVTPSTNMDLGDTARVKSVLETLGLPVPGGSTTPYPTRDLFNTIRAFQQRHGLVADGEMKPGGETEAKMNTEMQRLSRQSDAQPPRPPQPAPSPVAPRSGQTSKTGGPVAGSEPGAEPGTISVTLDGERVGLDDLPDRLTAWNNIVNGGITDEAGASTVNEAPEEVKRKVGEALLGILPGTGEAMEAKDAYDAFQAAREAVRRGDLSDAGINAAMASISTVGAIPLFGKAPAAAKMIIRMLARSLDTVTDGKTISKAAGATAIGTTGALMGDSPREDEKRTGSQRTMLDRPFPPPPGFEPPDTPLPDRTESPPTENLSELKETFPALEEIDTILEGFPDQRDELIQILILQAGSRGAPPIEERNNFLLERMLNKLKEIGLPRRHVGGGTTKESGYQAEHHFKKRDGIRARRSDGRIEVEPTLGDLFFEDIQTVDTLADGKTMTARERDAAQDIKLHKEKDDKRGGLTTYPKHPGMPLDEWKEIMGPRVDAYVEATFGRFRKKS
ncbi:MAG: peptidoglycan-binding domain-containing protein [Rhodospirillales bacterium]